jgi:hypothetical protein
VSFFCFFVAGFCLVTSFMCLSVVSGANTPSSW